MPKSSRSPENPRAIRDPEHIRLLASAVRHEIVDTLAALGGEATVAALAEQLGRPADGLYYHLQRLADGGLLVELDAAGGDRVFALADAGRGPLRLAYDLGDDEAVDALAVYVKGLLSVAESDFRAALGGETAAANGAPRRLWAARNKGWLCADDLEEVNALLERLCELMSRPRDAARGMPMSLAFVLAPTAVRPRRRGVRAPDTA